MSGNPARTSEYYKQPEGGEPKKTITEDITRVPWYAEGGADGLDHLRMSSFAKQIETNRNEGIKHGYTSKKVSKWRPGCCKNCGSDQHTEADCTERPRKVNAIIRGEGTHSGKKVVQKELSYEAKRDIYANYSGSRWLVDSKQAAIYNAKIRAQASQLNEGVEIRETFGSRSSRNRQDTADYIKNIDGNGAEIANDDSKFVKPEEVQEKKPELDVKFSWEAGAKTKKVEKKDLTEEAMKQSQREFAERKKLLNNLIQANEDPDEVVPKSERYGNMEDVYVNGHTSVWGSFFCGGQWGYACCHQTDRNSICTAQKD